ncbi:MAG: hypothetical protein ILP24_07805 [Paludibacteraceae bacterium]|nr:hypothetical protein [Paludibacteraceae bacterium]
MRIISEHNKKDFYDYSGFGYDTSDDIIFLRFPKEEIVEDNRYRYFDGRLPYDDWFENYVIIYNIVGIYPYCYIIPILTDNYEDITTKQQIVIPYELTLKKVEDINDFLKNTGQKICLQQPKYFSFINGIEESFWKDEDIFKQLETPVFLCYPGFNPTQKYTDHLKIIKNVIFNEQNTNWLKYIEDDLDKRDVYTDIENYLWSMKQEPTSEPDNKTKIVSHGFDLKTSFRKM